VPHPASSSTSAPSGSDDDDKYLPWAGHGEQTLEEWDARRFRFVALLQEAPRNNGRVELCQDLDTSQMVAVKAMPLAWVCESHEAFRRAHPQENELPWRDFGALDFLSRTMGLRCVCAFVGLYSRPSEAHGREICLVLSYCSGGDLFSWLERGISGAIGVERENAARPLMLKVVQAVRDIHLQGVAHGDLSLENILLEREVTDPALGEVRLIDFGACSGRRARGLRGKPSYQAPEVHTDQEYCAFTADAFSVGVMIFTLVVGNYPWRSTRPHVCQCWRFCAEKNLVAYLAKRKLKCGGGPEGPERIVTLAELLSRELVDLLSGMFAVDPERRIGVAAALEHPWFARAAGPNGGSQASAQGS